MDPELLAKARTIALKMRSDGVPDASIEDYLQKQIGAGLKDVLEPTGRDYARAAGMGATFGFEDELAGAGAAIVPGGKGYTQARDEVRRNYAAARAANPKRMLATEVAGAIAPSLLGAGFVGNAARGAGLGARVAAGVVSGAAAGGTAGVGYSEDHPVRAGLTGAATGAAIGGALPVAGAVVGKTVGKVINRFNPLRAVASASGHLLPDDAATTMLQREALAPGTTVPAALSPELPASLRVIGANAPVARAAQKASTVRLERIQQAMRGVGQEMEAVVGDGAGSLAPEGGPNIRRLVIDNGIMPNISDNPADVGDVSLKAVQALRNRLRLRAEGSKGMAKAAMKAQIRQLSDWLNLHAPELAELDQKYAALIRAKKAEESILKNVVQSRKSYSSSRAAGIEPGSPGASLPSSSTIMQKLLAPDRAKLAEAVNHLLLTQGRIPPQLMAARLAAQQPGMLGPFSTIFGSEGAGAGIGLLTNDHGGF